MTRAAAPTSATPLTWARLSTRALVQQRWVCLLVVVIVALIAGLLAAWPRVEADARADQVRFRLADASSLGSDVAGRVSAAGVVLGLAEDPYEDPPRTTEAERALWDAFDAELEALRLSTDAPLRDVLAPAQRVAVTEKAFDLPINPAVDVRGPALSLAGDPTVADRVTLADGRWPEAPAWDGQPAPTGAVDLESLPDLDVEVVVLQETAERLGLTLGEPLRVPTLSYDLAIVPVGTYTVDDPDDPYWRHITAAASPGVVEDLNAGTSVVGVGYTAADGWWRTSQATAEPARVDVWYAVDPGTLDGVDPARLGAQLRAFLGADHSLTGATFPGDTRFTSELPERLDAVAQENEAVAAVVLLVAVGPLGVALAVLALVARLLLDRRRRALAMIAARGASPRQLRTTLGVEGLLLGLPAAALGWGAVAVALGGDPGARGWVPSLALGLVPALVLTTAPLPSGLRRTRRDLRAGGVVRDVVVAVLAALVLAQVIASPTGAVAGTGDPLLIAAPLVLALAVTVAVLRVYPWLARAAHAALRRGRSLPHVLGSARAVRESAASLTSVLAVVVGVSVAVFSVVALGSLRAGLERTVWVTAGADLRISGPVVDADQLEAVQALDGVAAVAAVSTVSPAILQLPGSSPRVQLVLTDTAAYAAVLQDVPGTVGAAPVDSVAADDGVDPVPVLTSPRLGGQGADGVRLVASQNVAVEVLASGDVLPGVADSSVAWVLADAAGLPEAAAGSPPRLLLVRVAPGADPATVGTAITDVIGPAAVERSVDARDAVADTPAFRLLAGALTVSIVLAALLAVAALVLVQVTAAPARGSCSRGCGCWGCVARASAASQRGSCCRG
ncbi:hypothetical protein C8046_16880 [Serinibacter arcticus]|uniref:ABC3 transporter permease C-terminal domain-containing protein n=1 Tax=Serinibacter arcticus TaxID=1655435 RepID=A0A2U1ZYS9_9MICO|nr:FtsX-like permease family protein [Serinibacter arcticus]PWD52072.1 hypothetical protein C8046_16880 [Serinibacter arcticus]